jgi:hypothetical protein
MCFGLGLIESLLLWLVIVCAIIALLQLIVRFLVPRLGLAAEVVTFITGAAKIVMIAVICIAAIYFIFDLIYCLGPSMSLPRIR